MTSPISYTKDMDGVYRAVEDLAYKAGGNGIAAHLHALGVRGEAKTSFDCPLANWLRLLFGQDCDPEVDEGSIYVHGFGPEWIQTPYQIDAFISEVDSGEHQELIKEAS